MAFAPNLPRKHVFGESMEAFSQEHNGYNEVETSDKPFFECPNGERTPFEFFRFYFCLTTVARTEVEGD